jgi:hypothetical protein
MTRKPAFWAVFAIVAVIGATAAVRLFPVGFPLVSLDIRMDRATALDRASGLAAKHGWGPKDHRLAASFDLDDEVQSFVELEGGGAEAFSRLLREGLSSPYRWHVRLFQEQTTNETLVRFTPAGDPHGFREKIPESDPGAALDKDAARRIAEDAAQKDWAVDFGAFTLVEASQETRPGKRVDHTFVYERPDLRLGEGRYRLRLVVSGDRFTELTHFVKIPEAFGRRYSEMRSRNDAVAFGATAVVIVLYGSGIVIGLFMLLRRRAVVWKPALKWAGLIAVLLFGTQLARWPLLWMSYDTAVSSGGFAAQQIAIALAGALVIGGLAALAFTAGESLTRRAFPHQLQLWRIWSPEVARSRSVLGQTVAAYLSLGLLFAYVVVLYAVARRYFGWWMPASALSDPNIVATYFPWLSAIAISLQAGFLEETLFRAVPLAIAAILGERFGRRRLWIGVTLVLQAVVFGAAHANYPAQPAWARMVEIAVPFTFVGLAYVVFGLLPVIVLHFAFDVVFFALPLFASSAPAIMVDRVIVIALAFVPLFVVLAARVRGGAWGEAPAHARNAAFTPAEALPPVAEEPRTGAASGFAGRTRLALVAAGLAGLVAWVVYGAPRNEAPAIAVSAAEARATARQALEARGIRLTSPWKELVRPVGDVGPADRFVWQQGGPDAYRRVMGTHIEAPHWLVRYARFEGDVVDRAEEYLVHVGGDGKVFRIVHTLPEGRAGKALAEDEARTIARAAVLTAFGLDAAGLKEVSAEASQRPARRDWRFVFSNPALAVGGAGEARLSIGIAGDEIVDTFRFIHVPEDWQRGEQDRATKATVVAIAAGVLMAIALISGAVMAIVRWSRRRFAVAAFLIAVGGLAVVLVGRAVNSWPAMSAQFMSSQPWGLQAGMAIVLSLIGAGGTAAVLALCIGLVHRALPPQPAASRVETLVAGAALGAVWAGLGALGRALAAPRQPAWASFDSAGTTLPALGVAIDGFYGWIVQSLLFLLALTAVDGATRGWTRRRGIFTLVLFAVGLVVSGLRGVETIPLWLAHGAALGLVVWLSYVLVLRFQLTLLPVAAATLVVLSLLREATYRAHPGAVLGSAVAIAAVVALAVWWTGRLGTDAASAPALREESTA